MDDGAEDEGLDEGADEDGTDEDGIDDGVSGMTDIEYVISTCKLSSSFAK